jgi:phosphohistidine phosphatase
MGRTLAGLGVQVDLIITSPLKRSAQTASLVGNEIGYEGKLVLENALRPEANYSDFQKMLAKYARHESILAVGHNPNLREFLGRIICGNGCEAAIELKKGAVAKVEMRRSSGSLSWCFTPRIVRTVHAAAAESARPKSSRK